MHIDMTNYTNKVGKEKILNLQENFLKELNNYYKNRLVVFAFPNTHVAYKKIIKKFIKLRQNSYFFDKLY